MHIPVNGVQKKRFRGVKRGEHEYAGSHAGTVTTWKDLTPVHRCSFLSIHAPDSACPGGGGHAGAILPQLEIALEPLRHSEFVDIQLLELIRGCDGGLAQDFWEQRIAMRIRQVELMGACLEGTCL